MTRAEHFLAKLDRVTLAYLEHLGRLHLDARKRLETIDQADAWVEHGERLADAIEAFRKLVRPDPIRARIEQGLRR